MEMVHFIPPSQRRLAMLAAQADHAPVLICGEAGTGKGAIANWIHANGPRILSPLIAYVRGRELKEQLATSQGGTFLIHEIGSWSLSEQKALLHLLKTRSLPDQEIPMIFSARIITTTSQSLEGRAQAGMFNPELLQRLNIFRLEMPQLARRTEEFIDIVEGILGEMTREQRKDHIRGLSQEAWDLLRGYDWPGNLRELRNVLQVAVASCRGDELSPDDLPEFGHDRVDFRATREEFGKTMNRFRIQPELPANP